jgi:hypothetical protein
MPPRLKLGRLPRDPGAKFLCLRDYCTAPRRVSEAWYATFGATFRNYGNQRIGNCTVAAVANLASAQGASEGASLAFTEGEVCDWYFDLTGGQDIGARMLTVLERVACSGFPSPARYRAAAHAAVIPHDLEGVRWAASTFHGLYVGAQLPLSAETEKPWDVVRGAVGDVGGWGGHALALVGYDRDGVTFVTWGRLQRATWRWWSVYVDECYVLLDEGRRYEQSVEWPLLLADLEELRR